MGTSAARAVAVACAALAIVIGIAVGLIDAGASFLIGAFLAASIPIALIAGLIRLLRDKGVTLQAVAGALAIYLMVGLLFASTIGFMAEVQSDPDLSPGQQRDNRRSCVVLVHRHDDDRVRRLRRRHPRRPRPRRLRWVNARAAEVRPTV